ncbi:MAG: flagellar basal body P-ring protein FlgI, partial [Alphaproteobacteria bacterium]|nr:flagellar basal body P-ring protein FlgI [Alphaproteobacteria bacterium]
MRWWLNFALTLSLLGGCAPAWAERIKDMGNYQGLRANQLTGYGIVVGLPGTGDDNLDYTVQGMKGAISRFGLTLPPGINPALKNAAAVVLTTDLPPFAKSGQRLDVTVSALGKAKSLRGGTLLMAPLYGVDSQIYAMAQGNLVVGGLGVDAADGSKITINIPSAGRIDGGATVEKSVDTGIGQGNYLYFNLNEQDVTNSIRVAQTINATLGANTAIAEDGATVRIAAPPGMP